MKNNFIIETNYHLKADKTAMVLAVPRSVSSEAELMEVFARGLNFPEWFGRNWDALFDSLRDLSWLDKKKVVIVHEDVLDKLPEKDLSIYLEILCDAVTGWRDKPGDHELEVVFPREPVVKMAGQK